MQRTANLPGSRLALGMGVEKDRAEEAGERCDYGEDLIMTGEGDPMPTQSQPLSPQLTAPHSPALPAVDAGGKEDQLVQLATLLFFTCLAVILSLPLFSRASWMIFVQDDFLYYLKVAQNLTQGHGSTFNGVVPTNGYQPLWFLVLTGLSFLTQNPRVILAFLAVSDFAAAIVTFWLANKLLRSTEVRSLLRFALAAWVTLYSVTLFFYGMEVTLTVPILLGVICLFLNVEWLTRSPRHTFLLGLLLSAMVLSRIDTLIFGGLVLAGILFAPSLRGLMRPQLILGAVVGLLPLPVYFAVNHAVFHTWLPVSGMAKELKANHLPSIEPWRVFFHPLAGLFTLIIVSAIAVLAVKRRQFSPMQRVLFAAVMLFPFAYYFLLSCVSDWTLWGWYMYPIRTALCVSLLVFCLWEPSRRLLQQPVVAGLLLLSVFADLALLRWTRQQTDIYAASVEIQQFAQAHPGVYAMGDRAGRVALLIPDPIIQTEGLMMDRDYLRHIEHKEPLRQVLAGYNVRYYVATAYEPFTGCFQAGEPAKAGPTSAHMRSTFCEAPQATFFHDGIETLIFDLKAGQ